MKKQLFNLLTFQLFNLVSCMGALAVFVPSAGFAAAQPVLSLPPFVITGRVTDDRGAGLESAEVRVRKGETLLARGNVGKFEADTSANYALSVPMVNTNIATAAVAGDTLTLEIDSAAGTYSDTNLVITAAKPGRTLKLNVQAAQCTNPYGLSDSYLADILSYVVIDFTSLSVATASTDRDAATSTSPTIEISIFLFFLNYRSLF